MSSHYKETNMRLWYKQTNITPMTQTVFESNSANQVIIIIIIIIIINELQIHRPLLASTNRSYYNFK